MNEELKNYWETVRLRWVHSEYEKARMYMVYKSRLLKRLNSVRTSLEVGYGDGRWMSLLKTLGIDAYGIDILENAALQLKNEGFSPIVADAREIPFRDDFFDLVYSFGVVEHFEGTENAIEEHVRVARPGGRIVITVPYLYSPLTLYWAALHVKRGTFKKRPATFGKRYTAKNLREILEPLEVENITIEPFLFSIPKVKRIHLEAPLLEKLGLMLWAEMTKKRN
ncbi:MAG: class I SAM-dependent methyltransferase [Theionarchaea archaeon]|nr:class I SAM-dependent methyltransferase [Theionarchaea archaeon]MBU7000289.1 class I SAM-dependent methyltransferase [Theionarchaea archaeon]MBU7020731.1 class I SAM-dependent methyltransferase [Theionarchaea archaeon]